MTTGPRQAESANTLKSHGGPARVFNALRYSLQGLGHALRHEAAFRQELLFVLPAMIAAWCLPVTRAEQILLFGSSVLVLIVELLNSAIEATVDRISDERHPLSGRAKDLGSAAVLLAIVLMAVSWGVIGLPLLAARF